jgi:hypothetical protein
MSYANTFILASDDCPEPVSIAPPVRGERPSVAVLEYELLAKSPYRYTRDELLFIVHVTRLGITPTELKQRGREIRAELFSKPHACMRASPLPKRYGWGIHHDAHGRIGLIARPSAEYEALARGSDKNATVLKAMRNKRET